MPRLSGLNIAGCMHYVSIPGVGRCNIFEGDRDRADLVGRLAVLLPETKSECLAWALLSHHAHHLLRCGTHGLSTVMQRLLSGYVVRFNSRHNRRGPLLHNRYKSVACREKYYLKGRVGTIHLNPLWAGEMTDLDALARRFELTPSAVWYAVARGENISKKGG